MHWLRSSQLLEVYTHPTLEISEVFINVLRCDALVTWEVRGRRDREGRGEE